MFDSLVAAVDPSTVVLAILGIAALLVAVNVIAWGSEFVLRFMEPSDAEQFRREDQASRF